MSENQSLVSTPESQIAAACEKWYPDAKLVEWADPSDFDRLRAGKIGGSRAAVACGLPAFGATPIDLWAELTGRVPAKDLSTNPRVRAGNALEDGIRRMAEAELGVQIVKPRGTFVPRDGDIARFAVSNLDGIVIGAPGSEHPNFEAKNSSQADEWGPARSQDIPERYLVQVHHNMMVTGARQCVVAVLLWGYDLRCYIIERNESLIGQIREAETDFFGYVERDECPANPTGDAPASLETIRAIRGYNPDTVMQLPAQSWSVVDAWRRAKADEAEAKKRVEALRTQIEWEMGQAAVVGFAGRPETLVRQVVSRKGYTVAPSEHFELRLKGATKKGTENE